MMAYGSVNVPGHVPEAATTSKAGLMSAADKAKLDSLGKNLTFTGAATGTYNGQAAKTVLIPDRKGCRFIIGTSTAGWTEKDCDYLCDGTDDQVEINNAIKALPSTGGKIIVLEGTYNISSDITVNKKDTVLTGCGFGTILKRVSAIDQGNVINATAVGVRIEHLTVDGNNFTPVSGAAFGIRCRATRSSVSNCYVKNCTSYAIFISHNSGVYHFTNNIIENCGSNAIYVSSNSTLGKTHVVITGNIISNAANAAINVFHPGMVVSNNIILSCKYGITTSYSGGYANSETTIISNNRIEDCEIGISTMSQNNIICNNMIHNATSNGMIISGPNNIVANNNIKNSNNTISSMSISSANGLVIGNLILGKTYTSSGTGILVTDNKVVAI